MSRGDPLRVRDYLEHIAQAIANIREYTAGMSAAAYLADRKTQDAVVRNFEVVGEACNNVLRHHAQFAAGHPEIPWNFAYEIAKRPLAWLLQDRSRDRLADHRNGSADLGDCSKRSSA